MEDKKAIESKIYDLIDRYFEHDDYEFVPGKTKIPLQKPPMDSAVVKESLESLLSTWLTMGKKVKSFEQLFASYIGTRHATMVNSGSSANLLALAMLRNPQFKGHMEAGDEVVTPAVTWATTVYPIADVGLTPVLAEVDADTFDISPDAIEAAITDRTKAIMPVHLLGNPCDMKRIMEIAEENDLFVLEDSCEAHGAEVGGKKVGSMGDMGTFSFFMSHHITTIEGGMITTNDEDLDEMSRSMRVFGWIRDMREKEAIAKRHPDIDQRFLFNNVGYNMRPTEIQGAFGMHQIKKLEGYIDMRRENARHWNKTLSDYSDFVSFQTERPGTRHAWFSYPITVKEGAPFKRSDFMGFLEGKMIETRPIQSGNIARQPVIKMIKHRVSGNLENSDMIHSNSFFIGNHQAIGSAEREYVSACFDEFLSKVGR